MNIKILSLALNFTAVIMLAASLLSHDNENPRILIVILFALNCAYTPYFFRKAWETDKSDAKQCT